MSWRGLSWAPEQGCGGRRGVLPLDAPGGLGWVCPAGAQVVLGGQLAPGTVEGLTHCALAEGPKQAGCPAGDSSGNSALSSHLLRGEEQPGSCWGDLPLLGAKQDQARAQQGQGQCAAPIAAGAVNTLWGLLQQLRHPQEKAAPVHPAWLFGDGTGVGDILRCHFFWWEMHLELCLLCYASLSPSPLFQTLFPSTWRNGGHSNFWPKLRAVHKREERFGFGFSSCKRDEAESVWSEPRADGVLEPHFYKITEIK